MSTRAKRRVVIGRVSGLHGVKGWVKLFSYTDPRPNLLGFGEVELGRDGDWRPARLVEGRPQGKTLVGRFEGVRDRDSASLLVGREIAVRREQLPPEEADEVYWTDLIGMEVINVDGDSLGAIDHLLETGANDVLVLRDGRERLIPFVRGSVVLEIDREAGRVLVDWDEDF